MSRKQPGGGKNLPENLPDDFFDSDKKSKKVKEDELAKELEQFEKEMAALQAESDEHLKEEFEKIQVEKNLDEIDEQTNQWNRIKELEKKAEKLKNKPTKKQDDDDIDLEDVEEFEENLFDWRSKGL